jgi:hypothetical protein
MHCHTSPVLGSVHFVPSFALVHANGGDAGFRGTRNDAGIEEVAGMCRVAVCATAVLEEVFEFIANTDDVNANVNTTTDAMNTRRKILTEYSFLFTRKYSTCYTKNMWKLPLATLCRRQQTFSECRALFSVSNRELCHCQHLLI